MIVGYPVAQHTLRGIPDGMQGTRATLKEMARMVRDARLEPDIRNFATERTQGLGGGRYADEARSLFEFVRDDVRYVQDVNNVETLQYPVITLARRCGDCDDKATLLAALLESIGHPCRFVAVGYNAPGEFDHVWLETLIARDWIACETTMPVDFGWYPMQPNVPEKITCLMREHI